MSPRSEFASILETLARDQHVNLGVGDAAQRGWYRAQILSHDVESGRLKLKCFMDRATDRPLEPGERVVVTTTHVDDEVQSAPMDVEHASSGPEALVQLRIAGAWQREEERRRQVRLPVSFHAARARRWVGGAWRDLDADVVDLSSRGVGLNLDQEVHVGDRLSIGVPIPDGGPELRTTVEIRHVRPRQPSEENAAPSWRAGGLVRNLAPPEHERVIRFIFAELRSR
jgi:hypothetical protein